MLERELAGIMLICLVASTIGVMLFLGERAKSRIEILKVEYPKRFNPGEDRRFALNILARKDVESLVVRYSYLRLVSKFRIQDLYQTEGFNESVRSDDEPRRFLSIPEGSEGMREELPTDVGYLTQYLEIPFEYRKQMEIKKTEISLRLYDYCEMLRWAPKSAVPDIYTTTTQFAVMSIPEGNISVMEGVADYYLNREDSLSDVEVGKEDNVTKYYNPEIREAPAGYRHVDEAPGFGTVDFGSLEEGQRAYLSFTTRDIATPAIQVVRFWVDGEFLEDETRINMMGNPFRI